MNQLLLLSFQRNSKNLFEISTFNHVLLAAYLIVGHFKSQIEDRHVTLYTDHKSILSIFKKKTNMHSDK